ncbi:hypothetical protein SCLCIDRAFT_1225476 [Scleroderma citrinum Foug A]|uniref:Uncharacterized protein n=1 Tax=Scleroderma citrinum Foug A TaxID=1036808 RepID=A0A0C3CNH0_9AGAM|nr:hypothetical protein SCLCIDRAFT_1225476 [Scleroderma citrinum Foug A]
MVMLGVLARKDGETLSYDMSSYWKVVSQIYKYTLGCGYDRTVDNTSTSTGCPFHEWKVQNGTIATWVSLKALVVA